ncbi:hypothetical protein MMC25_006291 [Agyrium rufum]|nr:hypothetical protein [Agyrium rufum]
MTSTNPERSLTYNARYEDLSRSVQGPVNPFKVNTLKRKNVLTGLAEEAAISDTTFNTQHRTFQSLGYSQNPNGDGAFVGDIEKAYRLGGKNVVQMHPTKEASEAMRRKRQKKGDVSIVDGEGAYKGPWARYGVDQYEEREALSGEELGTDEEYEEVEEEQGAAVAQPAALAPLATDYAADNTNSESTEFHGESLYDYQGRTYMHVPQDLDIDLRKELGSVKNYTPKKLIHTWKSHTKPITSLQFFPNSGHLLLSSSADQKVKLWDVYHERALLRTFSGHTKALTSAIFSPSPSNSGRQILTASYDRQMKLWDTETGQCVSRFTTGKIPHCVAFNPSVENGHEFLAGMSDKKIVQFDTRSGEMTQEYDHHLGPVNTITFVDNNRRFITTSDDKSLRAWEYNIPVPIKFIAEPYMYSMVRATPHPSGKYCAFQSGDNQIVVYASTDRFRQNRKKSFRGHNTAGYAVDLVCSPDGQWLATGDTMGYLVIFDWKTCKMVQKLLPGGDGQKEGKMGATTCVAWHPQETSKIASAGLDGIIRYWD